MFLIYSSFFFYLNIVGWGLKNILIILVKGFKVYLVFRVFDFLFGGGGRGVGRFLESYFRLKL